eukprot:scaffold24710_cov117-Cylindrotheca_fusiformis.AAC.1
MDSNGFLFWKVRLFLLISSSSRRPLLVMLETHVLLRSSLQFSFLARELYRPYCRSLSLSSETFKDSKDSDGACGLVMVLGT